MKDLLIHTSDKIVEILKPNKISEYDRPCICLSLNQFISYFGEYIYLFDKETLEENFYVTSNSTGGIAQVIKVRNPDIKYIFRSDDLGQEFKIYQPIDVGKYCIGIITNFNHMKGSLERRFTDKVVREKIDFAQRNEKR